MVVVWSIVIFKMPLVLANSDCFSFEINVFHLVLANFNGFWVDVACFFDICYTSNCFLKVSERFGSTGAHRNVSERLGTLRNAS